MSTNFNSSFENTPPPLQNTIDIKLYVFKMFSYWKLFVITIIIGLIIAKFVNGYKEKLYSLDTTISVKEENNPLFSTGTNIAFNWGGESNEIGTVKVIFISRSHNEKVVDSLQFYVDYLKDGRYRLEDIYGQTPFKINLKKDKPQLFNKLLKVEAISSNKVRISSDFDDSNLNELITYPSDISDGGNTYSTYVSKQPSFSEEYYVNTNISSPYLNFSIDVDRELVVGESCYIRFSSFDETVRAYRAVRVTDVAKGASIVRLEMQGSNKHRLVDYLNASVKKLESDKKALKIAFAVKTKRYIDTLFAEESINLEGIGQNLKDYKKDNNIFSLSKEGSKVFTQGIKLDKEQENILNSIESL
ncbi:MAG: hypothetical protein JKY69_03445, partial [Flavobacteriaceae bacterium]|nr:hypothetical protein [Flavobacteriaceae bacterium]